MIYYPVFSGTVKTSSINSENTRPDLECVFIVYICIKKKKWGYNRYGGDAM